MSYVLYLCDHKACDNARYCGTTCNHTTDIEHAVNFEKFGEGKYTEKDQSKSDDILIVRPNIRLKHTEMQKLFADLVLMKEKGIILLPPYCEVLSVHSDTDFKIELPE